MEAAQRVRLRNALDLDCESVKAICGDELYEWLIVYFFNIQKSYFQS